MGFESESQKKKKKKKKLEKKKKKQGLHGAALAKLGDTRAMLAAQLTALTAERGELLLQKMALGHKKGPACRV